ncbi:delta subunit of the central stalk of mitochondrial F1F0 ATP synthase, atp16, partial [Apophysomyces ossiformis]
MRTSVCHHLINVKPKDYNTRCQSLFTIYKATDVQQVNLAATSGDTGILANHVPTIEQLNPGVVEVIKKRQRHKEVL